jgi:hypothetical protein
VTKLEEIWHWEKFSQYDPVTKQGGMFTSYINCFLRLKQQADGWPRENMTEAEKDGYIADYERVEGDIFFIILGRYIFLNSLFSGVKLEKDQIERNEGMRAVAKLMLNTFWGKVRKIFIYKELRDLNTLFCLFSLAKNPTLARRPTFKRPSLSLKPFLTKRRS